MTRDEMLKRIRIIESWDVAEFPESYEPSMQTLLKLFAEEIPTYQFSLREDLKDDKTFLPTRAESQASGWDVRAAMKDKKALHIKPGSYVRIPLGFRGFCPEGWWLQLVPRSSSFAKKSLHALYGTIDEHWEGEFQFAAQLLPDPCSLGKELVIEFGEAIGQIIPVRRQEMNVISIDNLTYDQLCKKRGGVRGTGGFGSTSEKIKNG